MLDRRLRLRTLVTLGLVALVSALPARAETSTQVAQETQATQSPNLSDGQRYDLVQAAFRRSLVYESIQTTNLSQQPDMFIPDLDQYRKYNGASLPNSLVFRDEETRRHRQLGYSLAFAQGAFYFAADTGEQPTNICSPENRAKRAAYNDLTDSFQYGQGVDQKKLAFLLGGASPDCLYFDQLSDNEMKPYDDLKKQTS